MTARTPRFRPALPSRLALLADPANLALLALLVASFALRVYGFNWDEGQLIHPDEQHVRDIAVDRVALPWPPDVQNLLDPAASTLNPRSDDPAEPGRARSFAYGSLPLYVTDLAAAALNGLNATPLTGWLAPGNSATDWHGPDHVYKVGRSLSILLDTATVFLVYLIGRRIGGGRAALLAAAVAGLAPISIQLAHFFTTDSWLTFFVALCLLCTVEAARSGANRWFAASGATFGLALATKSSVAALAGVVAVAVAFDVWRRWRAGERDVYALAAAPERIAIAGFSALVCFAIFEPYALLRPSAYRASIEEQTNIQRGIIDVPYTRQYIGTIPLVYHAEQLVRYGFGPVGGLAALAGLPLLAWRFWRRQGAGETILLAWVVGYCVVLAVPETKFIRYLAPMTPALAISAGLALDAALRWLARRRPVGRPLGRPVAAGLAAVALAGLVLWAVAFAAIYGRENTRLAASQWIYANVPSGSTFSAEVWDRSLPLDLRGKDDQIAPGLSVGDRQYQFEVLDSYRDRPTWGDLERLRNALAAHPATQPAATAMAVGDYRLAAASLERIASSAERFDEAGRRVMDEAFSSAASSMADGSGGLRQATRDAATNLATGGGDPSRWSALAEATLVAAEEEPGNALYRQLQAVDYYVVSSNRVTGSLPRSPWRYPTQITFFRLLDSGQLGFTRVAEFTSRPGIGPFEVNDDAGDEAWINYDHPRVVIYQKSGLVEKPTWDALFAEARAQPVSPTRQAPDDGQLLLDEPVGELPTVADAQWSAALTSNSAAAFAVWLLLLAVLQVVGWPIAALAFGRAADAGWGVARLLAMLLAGYVVWLGASIEVIAFRAIWCGVALALVGAVGWGLRRRWRSGRALWVTRPGQRRTALAAEAVFWLVFALFFAFRWVAPDSWHPIWGGEKPMEFAHLNATLRSAHFPPFDPWYAGGYVNYYYYGLYLVAFCLKLTGIPSEIAYNLAQPTVMAMLASAGFGVAATLGRDLTRRRALAVPAGIAGTLLLVGIGNLSAFFRWLSRPADVGDGFGYYTWDPSRAISNAITEFPFFTGLYGDLHAHVVAMPVTVLAIGLGYALAREPRRLPLALASDRRDTPARVVTLARLGLLGLAVGTLFPTNAWDVATYVGLASVALFLATAAIRPWPARLALAASLAAAVGALAYVLFLPFHRSYVALFSSVGEVRDPTPLAEFGDHVGGLLTVAGMGIVVVLLGGVAGRWRGLAQPAVPALVVIAVLAALRLARDAGSTAADGLDAALVVVVAAILGTAAWAAVETRARTAADRAIGQAGLVLVGIAVAGTVLADRLVLACCLGFVGAGVAAFVFGRGSAERYAGLMVATAAAIAGGVEVVFLADNLREGAAYRMNTVFKFYNQVWVLLALGGGALLARMLSDANLRPLRRTPGVPGPIGIVHRSTSLPLDRPAGTERFGRDVEGEAVAADRGTPLPPPAEGWARFGLVAATAVIALSLFYPILATGPRLEQRFDGPPGVGSLNGLDWMDYGVLTQDGVGRRRGQPIAFADDRAAIEWFNDEVPGSPVIAEASIGPYRGNGSRFSIATGLPTIIGWDNHETQQRFAEQLEGRTADVERLYDSASPDEKLEILRRYGVEYVVVGGIERHWAPGGTPWASSDGIAAFEPMVGSSLEVAFRSGETVVYKVVADPGTAPEA